MSEINIPKLEFPEAETRLREWLSDRYDDATRNELKALIDAGNTSELSDRFYRTLEFGTGGLRGKLGAGVNRMNSYIVARATQGLASYVSANAEKPGPLRAAIAHDSRHRSREFAETIARVFAANGFIVYLAPDIRATPWLSFAIRLYGCHTGVVVTASHNPKEYNGYKAYWDDGSQVVPPHDKGIIKEVENVTDDSMVKLIDFEEAVAKGLIKITGPETDEAYFDAVQRQRVSEQVIRAHGPKIVYTPLHGVGGVLTPEALKRWGFANVLCEPDQMIPDGNFPTAASPNPEEAAALDRAITLAKKEDADLVLATDPDADRLGIAVKHKGEFKLLSGNQVCALLADYILEYKGKALPAGKTPGIVSTIVTSPLLPRIAQSYGAPCPLVLTGFKWIASKVREWEAMDNGPVFLYGTEESYGYLVGDHCRDKDGVVASCALAELAAHCAAKGQTLVDKLFELYAKHGVHVEWQKSLTLPGIEGAQKIQAILESLRTNPPAAIGPLKVTRYTRYDSGEVFENGKLVGKTDVPPSDVFQFDLEDGSKAIARPSGTEPKIKFYFFLYDIDRNRSIGEAEESYRALESTKKDFEKSFFAAIGLGV